MSDNSGYMWPLVLKPTIIHDVGRYLTRCGEVVTLTSVSSGVDFGNVGTYPCGTVDRWHKSGRIHAGVECQNDIVSAAP